MKAHIILILLQVPLIICYFNISETSQKIKILLYKYKSRYRHRRHVENTTLNTFVINTLSFLEDTERYGEFFKYLNVSVCRNGTKGSSYVKRHIEHGLFIDHHVPHSHWLEYKSVFNKKYRTPHHERAALRQWRSNLRHVAAHNTQYLAGTHSYALHLNHLADFGTKEYMRSILKLIDTAPLHDPFQDIHWTTLHRNMHRSAPRKMDWRSRGFKPRREQQLHCGSCYAFAVAHAMQAQLYKKRRAWHELSVQQIVDCSGTDGNYGCDGGSLRASFRYVAREGLHYERDYPYIGKKGLCHSAVVWSARVRPRRWALLPAGDEAAMERALATIGPLAVAVNASPRSFQLYRSGIYDDPFCTPWKLNHAMLVVGYTPQYWVLMNWWGPHWGEEGYIRIKRGFNTCGVASMAAYVEL